MAVARVSARAWSLLVALIKVASVPVVWILSPRCLERAQALRQTLSWLQDKPALGLTCRLGF